MLDDPLGPHIWSDNRSVGYQEVRSGMQVSGRSSPLKAHSCSAQLHETEWAAACELIAGVVFGADVLEHQCGVRCAEQS